MTIYIHNFGIDPDQGLDQGKPLRPTGLELVWFFFLVF